MGMDHYKHVRDLGGTNGAFLACDKQNPDKLVVIKKLASGVAGMEELNVSLRLQHENIIKLLESFLYDGTLYVVLQYEAGGDLDDLLQRLAKLKKLPTNRTLLRWFEQLLSALTYCHGMKIIHRDIKPGNIFLSEDTKKLFLGDFGSAKALLTSSVTSTFVGSPMWISPEVLLGTSYSYPSDIWSLGCVFYEMACLEKPFTSTSFARLVNQITSGEITPLPAFVSENIATIIRRMLRLNPAERPTAAELLATVQGEIQAEEAAGGSSVRTSAAELAAQLKPFSAPTPPLAKRAAAGEGRIAASAPMDPRPVPTPLPVSLPPPEPVSLPQPEHTAPPLLPLPLPALQESPRSPGGGSPASAEGREDSTPPRAGPPRLISISPPRAKPGASSSSAPGAASSSSSPLLRPKNPKRGSATRVSPLRKHSSRGAVSPPTRAPPVTAAVTAKKATSQPPAVPVRQKSIASSAAGSPVQQPKQPRESLHVSPLRQAEQPSIPVVASPSDQSCASAPTPASAPQSEVKSARASPPRQQPKEKRESVKPPAAGPSVSRASPTRASAGGPRVVVKSVPSSQRQRQSPVSVVVSPSSREASLQALSSAGPDGGVLRASQWSAQRNKDFSAIESYLHKFRERDDEILHQYGAEAEGGQAGATADVPRFTETVPRRSSPRRVQQRQRAVSEHNVAEALRASPAAKARGKGFVQWGVGGRQQPQKQRQPQPHQQRQASHARPTRSLTEEERRAAEEERVAARQQREAERVRMREAIRAAKGRKKSPRIEIKLPENLQVTPNDGGEQQQAVPPPQSDV